MLKGLYRASAGRGHGVLREGLWVLIGQAAATVGALVNVRIMTELLSPVEYGHLALGLTIATLVNQIAYGPLGNGITRFYSPAAESGRLRSYSRANADLVAWTTCAVVGGAGVAVLALTFLGASKWGGIVAAALFYAVMSGHNSILNGLQNAARQRSVVALHQGAEPWLRCIIAGGLVVCLGGISTVAMLGYAVSTCVLLLSQYHFYRRLPLGPDEATASTHEWRRRVLDFSWPFAAWGVFTSMQLASDRWALEFTAGAGAVGIYAVLYQIGYYPISIATTLVTQLLAPILYQRAGDASDHRRTTAVRRVTWQLAGAALVGTALAVGLALAFHGSVFRAFVGTRYADASSLLPWIVLAGGLFAAGQTVSLDLLSRMETKRLALAKVTTAIVGIGLNVGGARLLGVKGVVLASVAFSVLYTLWVGALSWCSTPVRDNSEMKVPS